MFSQPEPRPLHREVLREALRHAWHSRSLWVFALFAGFLQTAGMYDVLLNSFQQTVGEVRMASAGWIAQFGGPGKWGMMWDAISAPGAWSRMLMGALLALIIIAISLIAQGALVAGIVAKAKGQSARFKDLIITGFRHLPRIALLNLITLGIIALTRSFLLIPIVLFMRGASVWNLLGTLVAFIVFAFAVVIMTSLHRFGLQILMTQSVGLWEALFKACRLFQRSWVIIIEKAFLLLLMGAGILCVAFIASIVASLPALGLLFGGEMIHSRTLAMIGSALSWFVFFGGIILAGMFTITFQYSAWNGMYRRVSDGWAMSKFHRLAKWFHEEVHLFRH